MLSAIVKLLFSKSMVRMYVQPLRRSIIFAARYRPPESRMPIDWKGPGWQLPVNS